MLRLSVREGNVSSHSFLIYVALGTSVSYSWAESVLGDALTSGFGVRYFGFPVQIIYQDCDLGQVSLHEPAFPCCEMEILV